jgi:hypothetical protein
MAEVTTWQEIRDGDRVIGTDARVYDVTRTVYGSAMLHDVTHTLTPRTGRPDPRAPARRLVRGDFSAAIAVLRAGGFDAEILI